MEVGSHDLFRGVLFGDGLAVFGGPGFRPGVVVGQVCTESDGLVKIDGFIAQNRTVKFVVMGHDAANRGHGFEEGGVGAANAVPVEIEAASLA